MLGAIVIAYQFSIMPRQKKRDGREAIPFFLSFSSIG